jgi:uncharacterized protein YbcI
VYFSSSTNFKAKIHFKALILLYNYLNMINKLLEKYKDKLPPQLSKLLGKKVINQETDTHEEDGESKSIIVKIKNAINNLKQKKTKSVSAPAKTKPSKKSTQASEDKTDPNIHVDMQELDNEIEKLEREIEGDSTDSDQALLGEMEEEDEEDLDNQEEIAKELQQKKKKKIIYAIVGATLVYVVVDEMFLKNENVVIPEPAPVVQNRPNRPKPVTTENDNKEAPAVNTVQTESPAAVNEDKQPEVKPEVSPVTETPVAAETEKAETTGEEAAAESGESEEGGDAEEESAPAAPAAPAEEAAAESGESEEGGEAEEESAPVPAAPAVEAAAESDESEEGGEAEEESAPTSAAPTAAAEDEGEQSTEDDTNENAGDNESDLSQGSKEDLPKSEVDEDIGEASGEGASSEGASGKDAITEDILKNLEKQIASRTQKREENILLQKPSEYNIAGRGLVYSCKGKHWACVDATNFSRCENNFKYYKHNKQKPDCFPENVYMSDKDCSMAQQRMINLSIETKFCD